jgi:hypothetical protein
MLWYIDPGYPTFNSIEAAEKAAYRAGIIIKKVFRMSYRDWMGLHYYNPDSSALLICEEKSAHL